jgi:hypothetical protein
MPVSNTPFTRTTTHPPRKEFKRDTTQTISLIVGFVLFALGLSGLMTPSFMGLHLSVLHSLIITAAGFSLFWNGYRVNPRASFNTCLGFGLFFGFLSVTGFVFGRYGHPQVGFERADERLLKIIPGFQELATLDHTVHAVIAVVLLAGAYDWWRGHHHYGAS